MNEKTNALIENYLIFSVKGKKYAIKASSVVELLWIPELTPIETPNRHVIGYFFHRGSMIPVIDLNLRQGIKSRAYSVNDRILIISHNQSLIGVHLSEIFNVVPIKSQDIYPIIEESNDEVIHPSNIIVFKAIRTEFGIAQVMHLDVLVTRVLNGGQKKELSSYVLDRLFSQLTEKDREVLYQRKQRYSLEVNTEGFIEHSPIAIVSLGGEYLGIELKYVVEFSKVNYFNQIPCTPRHISGCMNLRGDILVLLDLLYLLTGRVNSNPRQAKVVVSRKDDLLLGFIVDDLIDVVFMNRNQIASAPSMVKEAKNDLIKETCFHNEWNIGILDMDKIFDRRDLIVEEYVL